MKKAQASLEFLTTYAWAFIIIAIMISAIVYFGIINPKRFLPSRCTFSPEISCIDHAILSNGMFLRLRNNLNEPIKIVSLNLKTERGGFTCSTTIGATPIENVVWNIEETNTLSIEKCDFEGQGITEGRTEKFYIELRYYKIKSGPTFTNTVKGEVLGQI